MLLAVLYMNPISMKKELPNRIKAVAEYYIANPKLKQLEIAKQFNLSAGRVSQILRMRQVVEAYPILARRVVQSKFLPLAMDAYEKLIKQDKNLQVQEKAANQILKETGVFDSPSVTVRHEVSQQTTEELRALVERARGLPEQSVIEAEVVAITEETTGSGLTE